jgi:hypothetical protein
LELERAYAAADPTKIFFVFQLVLVQTICGLFVWLVAICGLFVWLVAGADLFGEKSTLGRLLGGWFILREKY